MRLLPCVLLLFASLAAQTGAPAEKPAPPPENPQEANAKHARALLDKAIQALGGQAYLSLVDAQQEGRVYGFSHGQPQGVGTLFWRFWKWPDKERIELTKQRDVIYIYNGEQGFETTFRGTRPQAAKDLAEVVRRRQHSLERVLRVWLNESGIALFYDGVAIADNKPAEQVTVMRADGLVVTIYLDKFNFLPITKSFTFRDPETRERNEESESYDNYHLVQGVSTPLTVTRKRNDEMTNQRFFTRVVYNAGLQDSLFTPRVTYDPEANKH